MPRLIPLGSAARTASVNSVNVHVPEEAPYSIYLDCTAASGTSPTLDVEIQESYDGGTTWIKAAAFVQLTAAGTEKKEVGAGHAPLVRVKCTIAGTTPSFTFEVRVLYP